MPPSPRRPAHHQWAEIADELHALTDRICADDGGPEALRRARIVRRDGFPTTSRFHEGGRPSYKVDDEDMPILVNDPTGEAVVDGLTMDPVRTAASALLFNLLAALANLRAADGARARAVGSAREDAERAELTEAEVGCVNCHRFGFFTIIEAAGRCSGCRKYRLRHSGEDAPEPVVASREAIRQRRAAADVPRDIEGLADAA